MLLWRVLAFLASAATATAAATSECHATAFIGTAYRDRSGTDLSIKAEIAAFADGYAAPATGELVRAGDGFDDMGCSLPWKRPESGPWVALVRRGGCSVELKIANAVHQGANGLIIYNNRDSLSLQNLRVTRKYQTLISVVFTYKWKGEELTTLLDFGTKIVAELSVANPCIAINRDHERNMQLVSISFLCFIVLTISLAWLIFYYVQRNRDIQARIRKARGYSEADEKALKSIPTKTLKSSDKLIKDESECCAICIDPYKQSETVRSLVCGHEFHKDCIDPWLLENRTCPMCKKDILQHYGSVFLGSQESIIQVVSDETHRLAGPSSPAIQVVVVANRRTSTVSTMSMLSPMPSPIRSPTASPGHSDLAILTERVQPANRDAMCFAESCSSLLTVDSAHEALNLVDSAQGTSLTPPVTTPETSNYGPSTSKSDFEPEKIGFETAKTTEYTQYLAPSTSRHLQTPSTAITSKNGVDTAKTTENTPNSAPHTSDTADADTLKTPPETPNPDETPRSLLDSCQELRESADDPSVTQPISVDDNDNPFKTKLRQTPSIAENELPGISPNESKTTEPENS